MLSIPSSCPEGEKHYTAWPKGQTTDSEGSPKLAGLGQELVSYPCPNSHLVRSPHFPCPNGWVLRTPKNNTNHVPLPSNANSSYLSEMGPTKPFSRIGHCGIREDTSTFPSFKPAN